MNKVLNDAKTALTKSFSEDCYTEIKQFLRSKLGITLGSVTLTLTYYFNWLFLWFGWTSFLILFILFGLIVAVLLCTCNKFKKRGNREGES